MKLPELLKKAVEEQDWYLICDAYENITGQPLEPPNQLVFGDWNDVEIEVKNQQKEKEEGEVFLPPEPEPTDNIDKPEFAIQHGKKKHDGKQRAHKSSMDIPNQREYVWTDDGTEHVDQRISKHPNDPSLAIQKVSARGNRNNKNDSIRVVCSLCGKVERVATPLAMNYSDIPENNTYKCNDCSTPTGRRKVDREIM